MQSRSITHSTNLLVTFSNCSVYMVLDMLATLLLFVSSCFSLCLFYCWVTLFLFTLNCIPSLSRMLMALVYQLLEQVCYKPSESAFSDALQPYNASKNRYQDKLPCKSKHVCSPVHKYSITKGGIT